MGETVPIKICNSNAIWFAPFDVVPDEIASSLTEIRKNQSEVHLDELIGEDAPFDSILVASFTSWREPFGLEKFDFQRYVAGDEEGRNKKVGEFSFWYADKFGRDKPDFVSFGGESEHYSIQIPRLKGVPISQDRYDRLVRLFDQIPDKIFRPDHYELYVEDVELTPRPDPYWFDERRESKLIMGTVEGIIVPSPVESEIPTPINVWGIYSRISEYYTKKYELGDGGVNFRSLPAIPAEKMHEVLERQGYKNIRERVEVIKKLDECGYLHNAGENGFLVTDEGVSHWNMSRRQFNRNKGI